MKKIILIFILCLFATSLFAQQQIDVRQIKDFSNEVSKVTMSQISNIVYSIQVNSNKYCIWTGALNTDYYKTNNWLYGRSPTSNDMVLIDNTLYPTTNYPTGPNYVYLKSLIIRGTATAKDLGIYCPNVEFYDSSTCESVIHGDVRFYDHSLNSAVSVGFPSHSLGWIYGNVSFEHMANNHSGIVGDAKFHANSTNGVDGTIDGNATFFSHSRNIGTVQGNATFLESSINSSGGVVWGIASFYESALDSGGIYSDLHKTLGMWYWLDDTTFIDVGNQSVSASNFYGHIDWTNVINKPIFLTNDWNTAYTWVNNNSNSVQSMYGRTNDWDTAYTWVNANSNNVQSMYGRTNYWDESYIWINNNSNSIQSMYGRTDNWNQAVSDGSNSWSWIASNSNPQLINEYIWLSTNHTTFYHFQPTNYTSISYPGANTDNSMILTNISGTNGTYSVCWGSDTMYLHTPAQTVTGALYAAEHVLPGGSSYTGLIEICQYDIATSNLTILGSSTKYGIEEHGDLIPQIHNFTVDIPDITTNSPYKLFARFLRTGGYGSSASAIEYGCGTNYPSYFLVTGSINNNYVLKNWATIPAETNITTTTSNVFDIGSLAYPFRSGYFGTNSLYLGDYQITKSKAQSWDGATNWIAINSNNISSTFNRTDYWDASYTWVNANSNNVQSMYGRTNYWDASYTWINNNSNSVQSMYGRSNYWDTSYTWVNNNSNDVQSMYGRTSTWDSAVSSTGGVINGTIRIIGDTYLDGNVWVSQTLYVTNLFVTNVWTTYSNLVIDGDAIITGTLINSNNFTCTKTNWSAFFVGNADGLTNANWDSAYSWINANSNSVQSMFGRTSYWDSAYSWVNANSNISLSQILSNGNDAIGQNITNIGYMYFTTLGTNYASMTYTHSGPLLWTLRDGNFDPVLTFSINSATYARNLVGTNGVVIDFRNGTIASTSITGLNTSNWDTAYTWVNNNSNSVQSMFGRTSTWDSTASIVSGLNTSNWDSAWSYINNNSNSINSVFSRTGTWNTASSWVASNSNAVQNGTQNWNTAYTYVNSNSNSINSMIANTSNWNTAYTWVNANSNSFDSITYSSNSVALVSSASTNFSITGSYNASTIVRGRFYVANTNNQPVSRSMRLTFWNNSTRTMGQEVWQADLGMSCTILSNAVAIGATNIFVKDPTDFSADNLVYLMNTGSGTSEFARVSSVTTNCLFLTGPVVAVHAVSNGVSRVREFATSTYDATGANKYWVSIVSPVSTNLSFKLDLEYKK